MGNITRLCIFGPLMNWAYSIDTFEIILLVLFALFYLLYVIRLARIKAKLNIPISKWLIKFSIRSLYVALIIAALLGPSFGETKREIKSVGKDIFVCVDLSESMNAFDVQPTRLEKVKFELKNIVEAFSSDRIGLIMFSNEAFMQCPLTYDNNALNLFIQALSTNLVPNSGTDFGPPLRMALKKLTSEESSVTQQKSKIIVLISDGEDFGEETETEEIESSGIKLFTLGVGTERGSKIQTRRGFKKNNKGEEVVSRLNDRSLKKVASDTGGKYFEINASRNDVERLINSINDIEGELRDAKQLDSKDNKYFYFLILALVLMLCDAMIGVKVIRI
ncbi:Ca-activated chloride channel family protein [Marinoscillum furvescens DSM 4134]|uniref:Ca-activated chloride channel family protein n=2 Tax=Marinoscillum furvescens TaxID=1026 RepID=A0A3D9L8W1_MARFU|nr:Ca-activated chloride channel family protein [Marinoscillum furvescens DSM 4134]